MTPEFAAKYKDPRWQRRRLAILERDEWTCRNCGASDQTLHVHHIRYRKHTEPWDYPDHLLVALCKLCHQAETEERAADELIEALAEYGAWRAKDLRVLSLAFHFLPIISNNQSFDPRTLLRALSWLLGHLDKIQRVVDEWMMVRDTLHARIDAARASSLEH